MSDRKYIVLVDADWEGDAEHWAKAFKETFGIDIMIATTPFTIVPFDPDGVTVVKPPTIPKQPEA